MGEADTLAIRGAGRVDERQATSGPEVTEISRNNDPQLAFALDAAGFGLWHWDLKRNRIRLNSTACEILRLDAKLVPKRLRECLDGLVHPDDREATRTELAHLATGRTGQARWEMRLRRADSSYAWMDSRTVVVEHDRLGRPIMIIGLLSDVTPRKAAERQLAEGQNRLLLGLAVGRHEVFDVERIANAAGVSSGALRVRADAQALPVNRWLRRIHPDYRETFRSSLGALFRGECESFIHECRINMKTGAWAWVHFRVRAIDADDDGVPLRAVGTITDISERKAAEDRLAYLAMHDPLTGLPNRTRLLQVLEQERSRVQEQGGRVGIMLLDLDHFKDINDSLGHHAGDALLRQIANRIMRQVNPSDFIARMGGDEFIIVSTMPAGSRENFGDVANDVIRAIDVPFLLNGEHVHVGTSIGFTTFPDDDADVDGLLAHADLALYAAKQSGRRSVRRFQGFLQERANARRALDRSLHAAIDRNELALYFQPMIDIGDLKPRALEALVRWRHPSKGLIGPDGFLPLIERNSLLSKLTDWVIRSVVVQLATLRSDALQRLPISINMPTCVLEIGDVAQQISDHCKPVDVDLSDLIVEVTEGAFADSAKAVETLSDLRRLGARIAIDDFGTGYSSMTRLGDLPIDVLKIDRSFLRRCHKKNQTMSMMQALSTLARSFGLATVAEGVETTEQFDLVRRCGYDAVQGFLFARPMPAEHVAAWLREWEFRRQRAPDLDLLRRRQ